MQHPVKKKKIRRLRRRWLILAAAAGLAAAAALVWLLPSMQRTAPTTAAPVYESSFRAFEITDAASVDSVTFSPPFGEPYTLRMQDGTLMLDSDGELQDLNDVYAENLLNAVTQIVAQAVVAENAAEVEAHLAEMGLDEPRASAVIRYTDGTQSTLELGGSVPNTTYSYCRWSGSPAIYMCDSGVADALNLTASRLLPITQPEMKSGLISEVQLENPHGSCTFLFDDAAYGRLVQPYAYPLGAEESSALLTALQNFRLGTRECAVTDENRAFYGLDQPLCTVRVEQAAGTFTGIDENGTLVTYTIPAQSLRFAIGRAEGEYFYTCEYEGECYFISRFLAEMLVNASAEAMASRNPADWGDLALTKVQMQTEKGTTELRAVYTERVLPNNELETDENGNVLYDVSVTLNGSASTEEQLDELLSRLVSMAVNGNAPADFQPEGEPRWSITLTAKSGLIRRLEGYRLDLFTDALAVDGQVLHTIDAEAIEIATAGILVPES